MMLAINRADLIFAHSTKSDFANYVIEHTTPDALDILTGFTNAEGQAMGRPTDARQAKDGALLVADDVGNTIWRVVRR